VIGKILDGSMNKPGWPG